MSWSQVSSWLTSWLFGSSVTQQPKQPAHQAGAAGPAKPGHDGWQVIACHAGQLLEDDRIREVARLGRALATVGGHLSSLLVAVQEQPRSPQEPGLNALAVMSGRWPQPKALAAYRGEAFDLAGFMLTGLECCRPGELLMQVNHRCCIVFRAETLTPCSLLKVNGGAEVTLKAALQLPRMP